MENRNLESAKDTAIPDDAPASVSNAEPLTSSGQKTENSRGSSDSASDQPVDSTRASESDTTLKSALKRPAERSERVFNIDERMKTHWHMVFDRIFPYLNLQTKINMSLVKKDWNKIMVHLISNQQSSLSLRHDVLLYPDQQIASNYSSRLKKILPKIWSRLVDARRLRQLDLTCRTPIIIAGDLMQVIRVRCTSLIDLNLRGNILTAKAFMFLGGISTLERLDVSDTIPESSLINAVSDALLYRLQALKTSLEQLRMLRSIGLCNIPRAEWWLDAITNRSHLVRLDAAGAEMCVPAFTTFLNSASLKMELLRCKLTSECCEAAPALRILCSRFGHLKTLGLELRCASHRSGRREQIQDCNIFRTIMDRSLSLPFLETLELPDCPFVNDDFLVELGRFSPCLKCLTIPGSNVRELPSYNSLATLGNLMEINLSETKPLNDLCIVEILRSCPRLKVLEIRHNGLVTGDFLSPLASLGGRLRKVDLLGCSQLDRDKFISFAQRFQRPQPSSGERIDPLIVRISRLFELQWLPQEVPISADVAIFGDITQMQEASW